MTGAGFFSSCIGLVGVSRDEHPNGRTQSLRIRRVVTASYHARCLPRDRFGWWTRLLSGDGGLPSISLGGHRCSRPTTHGRGRSALQPSSPPPYGGRWVTSPVEKVVVMDTVRGRMKLVEETPWRWRIDPTGQMRVPGIVFASSELLPEVAGDRSLDQVANVATLPGIVRASYAMPDVHWGYGFPIGGVAATDVVDGGVVSPGGVGFDISCGVRLLLSPFIRDDIAPRMTALMDELSRSIPSTLR